MGIKVSIIVPIYNAEKFIRQCVDSLVNQTLEDIEIVLVNDCSPDNCLSIIKEYEREYPSKVKVIDSKLNLRQGGARNLGLKVCKGEYVGFVDADDIVKLDMFEELYDHCKRVGKDVSACFGRYGSIDENYDNDETKIKPILWNESLVSSLSGKELSLQDKNDLMAELPLPIWCGIYKRDLIISNEVWFPENLRYEDNYWHPIVETYFNRVVFVDKLFYLYRKNNQSTVNAFNQTYHFDRIIIENMLLEEMEKRGLYKDYFEALQYIYTVRAVFGSIHLYSFKFDKPQKEQIKYLLKNLKGKFPQWHKSVYYKELVSHKRKSLNRLIFKLPNFYINILVPIMRGCNKVGLYKI